MNRENCSATDRRRRLSLLVLAATTLVGASSVPFTVEAQELVETQEEVIEEIVVTGSYIRRAAADSPSPLSIIDRETMENYASIEPADVINRMTYNSGSTNFHDTSSGGDNNTGGSNVNLRNLGMGATLVLKDGRRTVAGSTTANANTFVDMSNLVPAISIQRIEVLKDGASALYGADALAGTVNVITRNDFEGMEFLVDYRVDQETGDQEDFLISGIWGVGGDQGHLVVSAEFLDRQGIFTIDRTDLFGAAVSTLGQPGTFVPATTSDPRATGVFLGAGGAITGLGGFIAGDLDCEAAARWAGKPGGDGTFGGEPVTYRSPFTGDPQASTLERLGACVYEYGAAGKMPVPDDQRLLVHVSGSYELAASAEFYGSVRFADQEYRRGQSMYPLVRFPVIGADNLGVANDLARRQAVVDSMLAANPGATLGGIPLAGLDLTDSVDSVTFFGRLLGGSVVTPEQLRPVDTDNRISINERGLTAGLRGDLQFGENWTYDAAFTFSERESTSVGLDTRQDQLELALAGLGGSECDQLNGVAGSGNAGTGNCFYLNPFGSALVKADGSLQDDPMLMNSGELYHWVTGEIRTNNEYQQTVLDVVLTGDLIDMPSGLPLSVAFGGQWRRDEISSDSGTPSNRNNFAFIYGAPDFNGEENTLAAFVEFAVPVTTTFDLQLAARYETFDEMDESTFDPKITGLWRPIDSLSLRASWGTSFRIPSMLQRFGHSTQLLNISDPEFSETPLSFRPILTAGNLELDPEDGTVWNVGVSYEPASGLLENLKVSVDYYNYDIEDLVTREGFETLIDLDIAERCPQGINAGSSPDPARPLCGTLADGTVVTDLPGISEVVRGNNFQLLRVDNTFRNAQKLETDGIDLTAAYRVYSRRFGVFSPGLSVTWTRSWDLTTPTGSLIDGVGMRNFSNSIGRPLPEWKANVSLGWEKGRHSVFLLGRYIDGYHDDQPSPSALIARALGIDVDDRSISSMTTWDLQYALDLPDLWKLETTQLVLGGINIFNRAPPKVNSATSYDPTVHDPRGAQWYVRMKAVF